MEDRGSHLVVSLVVFSTSEPISLSRDSYMQRSGISMLHELASSQLPALHVYQVYTYFEVSDFEIDVTDFEIRICLYRSDETLISKFCILIQYRAKY
jgi:hypothetical protein